MVRLQFYHPFLLFVQPLLDCLFKHGDDLNRYFSYDQVRSHGMN